MLRCAVTAAAAAVRPRPLLLRLLGQRGPPGMAVEVERESGWRLLRSTTRGLGTLAEGWHTERKEEEGKEERRAQQKRIHRLLSSPEVAAAAAAAEATAVYPPMPQWNLFATGRAVLPTPVARMMTTRALHVSARQDSLIVLGAGLAAVGVAGYVVSHSVSAWKKHQAEIAAEEAKQRAARGEPEPGTQSEGGAAKDSAKGGAAGGSAKAGHAAGKETEADSDDEEEEERSSFFNMDWSGKRFYDGGFQDKMDRSEAAKILGVREYSSAERIREAHRRILILNHPDKGGSKYLATKVNEAKELLLKGAKSEGKKKR